MTCVKSYPALPLRRIAINDIYLLLRDSPISAVDDAASIASNSKRLIHDSFHNKKNLKCELMNQDAMRITNSVAAEP